MNVVDVERRGVAARGIDVRGIDVARVELCVRKRGSVDDRRLAVTAAELHVRERAIECRRGETVQCGYVVEPRRRELAKERIDVNGLAGGALDVRFGRHFALRVARRRASVAIALARFATAP